MLSEVFRGFLEGFFALAVMQTDRFETKVSLPEFSNKVVMKNRGLSEEGEYFFEREIGEFDSTTHEVSWLVLLEQDGLRRTR
jgi:hypothetical protein